MNSVAAAVPSAEGLQPFLHDACVTLYAPSFAISHADGQIDGGAEGFYHADSRALARLTVEADGIAIAPVRGALDGADRAAFRGVLRGLGEETPDPAVTLHRRRRVTPGRLEETLEVSNAGRQNVSVRLIVTAATDLAAMERVKSGHTQSPVPATATADGLDWSKEAFAVRLTSTPAPAAVDPASGRLEYDIELAPGAVWTAVLHCDAAHEDGDQFPAPAADSVPWRTPVLRSADRRFDHWISQSAADLDRLRLTDSEEPADQFLAAGAPWFLTLFGRDSLWAARMLLPLGTELAAGTLRTLARRQGVKSDPDTEEQPGKILHEVRRGTQDFHDNFSLPPSYYGTVDATPLWITLLHDSWRWGLAPDQVEQLLPHAESALAWMRDHGDAGGDGFLKYIDHTGRGLANQGWKDSGDSIRHRDGRLATSPIALCEVQAYAYEAARGGAALLRAFGRPGADEWEEWAERLSDRFRSHFWVEDERGAYPAVALDRDQRPVDSATSGFGHLLGTGLLNHEESALLAARLSAPDLDSGHGLRTLSSDSVGYNPYGYHIGSIWPHDTAIAVHGLTRAGFPDAAAGLSAGLLTASAGFDARLPELFAGHGSATDSVPSPYPASCRPQAWAAASSVMVLQSALGLSADVPGGTLTVAPAFAEAYRPLKVEGLDVAGGRLDITVAADGTAHIEAPAGLEVKRESVTPR
ncbi:amylo-alpha-1,6-glucosidase [Streptomyces scopuliridis]|uniref:Amylo-alpha-1,6-glucosidase n=2 Tax=Streptomyces scopuliridis TaxID=452529 RepID=A0A2T7SMG1_9ACTN|nr:glycogen debranching N-terminal domain-containing protein [Streptomyces scopuliridis]PVE04103.1 amylo-alpha-1,6-glucosidase [Streptomyces scopuliridis RB72]WSB32908.1 amylo-alpha-1,6-glucosidase [Streptomyces scopuliridis]WSB97154.1 amylo-alpha-1,6-glucosidase [Streptomyces scopuliridis]WSC09142.1 amylo-alpha-1,6-glucosidase [Streptomyces scopuliridis]